MTRRFRYAVFLVIVLLLAVPLAALGAPKEQEKGGTYATYVVRSGDTLADIAWSLGVPAGDLGRANGITNFDRIYPGQVLTVPGQSAEAPAPTPPAAQVQAESKPAVELQTETKPAAQASAESKPAAPQPTEQPAVESEPAAAPETSPAESSAGGSAGKWIDVDLSEQRLRAFEGDTQVFTTLVSTGTEQYPTPTGNYEVIDRIPYQDMSGPGYYLSDVPNVLHFKARGFAIHGTYWHDNFGHPMSHGCVNLPVPESAWLYGWAPLGTPVVIHD